MSTIPSPPPLPVKGDVITVTPWDTGDKFEATLIGLAALANFFKTNYIATDNRTGDRVRVFFNRNSKIWCTAEGPTD